MRRTLRILLAEYKIAVLATFQYRGQMGLELLGLLFEGVVYLVVWTTIARARGGEVSGYTEGEFAAYFIGWAFVRNIPPAGSLPGREERIRRGEFNALLTRPIHPYFTDMGRMLGHKTTSGITLIPTMLLMALAFPPEVTVVPWALVAVVPALALAFLMQAVWLAVAALLMRGIWRSAVQQYGAVGG